MLSESFRQRIIMQDRIEYQKNFTAESREKCMFRKYLALLLAGIMFYGINL